MVESQPKGQVIPVGGRGGAGRCHMDVGYEIQAQDMGHERRAGKGHLRERWVEELESRSRGLLRKDGREWPERPRASR